MSSMYTQKRSAQYRGPSTSDDYNKRVEENYKDLAVLMNKARIADVELDELFRRLVKENLSFGRVVYDLEARIKALEEEHNRFSFYSPHQIDNDIFDGTPFEIPQEDRCSYDVQHGLLTLPHITSSSMSKLFHTNTEGREVIPSSLEMRVIGNDVTADGPSAYIDSSEPQYSLFRKPGLIWERNVVVEKRNQNGAEMTLYVKAPTDLFTTANSNNILIHPFPYFGTTIREISYTMRPDPVLRETDGYEPFNNMGHYTGEDAAKGWVIPGGWSGSDEGDDAALNTGPRSYHFSPKPITAFKIRLHQDNYYQESGKYIYSYGLSQLDLRYNKYLKEGKTMIRIDAPVNSTISEVHDVQPEIWNVHPAELSNVFEYRVLWKNVSGDYSIIPIPNSESVWIEVTLRNTDSWTPALSGLIVDYS